MLLSSGSTAYSIVTNPSVLSFCLCITLQYLQNLNICITPYLNSMVYLEYSWHSWYLQRRDTNTCTCLDTRVIIHLHVHYFMSRVLSNLLFEFTWIIVVLSKIVLAFLTQPVTLYASHPPRFTQAVISKAATPTRRLRTGRELQRGTLVMPQRQRTQMPLSDPVGQGWQ